MVWKYLHDMFEAAWSAEGAVIYWHSIGVYVFVSFTWYPVIGCDDKKYQLDGRRTR